MIAKKAILSTGLMLGCICLATAQGYYDDDITIRQRTPSQNK